MRFVHYTRDFRLNASIHCTAELNATKCYPFPIQGHFPRSHPSPELQVSQPCHALSRDQTRAHRIKILPCLYGVVIQDHVKQLARRSWTSFTPQTCAAGNRFRTEKFAPRMSYLKVSMISEEHYHENHFLSYHQVSSQPLLSSKRTVLWRL